MSSPSQSLMERLKPRSLQERLSSPTLQCLTTGIENERSRMQTSNKRGSRKNTNRTLIRGHENEQEEAMETSITKSAMNRSTDDQRSIRSCSHGQCQIESEAVDYEMSALPPGISSQITPLTSNSPKPIYSIPKLRPNSQ